MDRETARRLNALTRHFYESSAIGFRAARELAWPSWWQVLEILSPALADLSRVSVLDVGCGNGRFAHLLSASLRQPFTYMGLDGSPQLVGLAEQRLRGVPESRCAVWDFVEKDFSDLPDRDFNLIAAFGVLHHVPGFSRRREFLAGLCRLLLRGGTLALSTWRLRPEGELRRKVLPWEELGSYTGEPIDSRQLEPGDHLILKENQGVRYCHFLGPLEMGELLQGLPLTPIASFDADGLNAPLNHYVLLRKV